MLFSAFFFHPELIFIIETYPSVSNEWKLALDQIGDDIKRSEELLRELPCDGHSHRIQVSEGFFELLNTGGNIQRHLCYANRLTPLAHPVIELPIKERLEAYRQFPELFEKVSTSATAKEPDERTGGIKSKAILEIIRESFEKAKAGVLASPNLERLIEELKILKSQDPTGDPDIKSKASWIKHLAEVLAGSKIFQQVFEQVKIQIPQIWSQLTFSQKLKMGALAPLAGAGAYLGGIGIAGGGSAVGVPVTIVILLLLMINNSVVDFLDFAIRQLSSIVKNEPNQDIIAKAFEELLSQSIIATFGKEYGLGQRADDIKRDAERPNARDFEAIAVLFLAKKYNGVGYVTSYSSDGGIDGYIISEANKEVVLIQAKHFQNKVGFPEATQYLGTFFYWKKQFDSKFQYPISKMVLACSTDFSIEAKKVANAFSEVLVLEKVPY